MPLAIHFEYGQTIKMMMRTRAIFKALSDPTRRKVLKRLQGGSMTAGELADAFGTTQDSLSHHFDVLQAADLVRSERRGQQVVYSLNTTVFEDVEAMFLARFRAERKKGTSR